jgi:DNA-directed RNA polymerase specialized sigma subunit
MAQFINMLGVRAGDKQPETHLEEEFAPHFNAWQKSPTPETAGQLLKTVDPILQSALRTYTGVSHTSPNLKAKAKLIALNSLGRYDQKQTKLRTYLMTNLQSLRREAAEEGNIIDVPERIRLDRQKLHTSSVELIDKLGREPSARELASHVGISLRRLGHINKLRPTLAEGQLADSSFDSDQSRDDTQMTAPRNRDVYLQFVYGDLHPIDQVIMEYSLGLHGKPVLPKGRIAGKLGISPGAVSQRAAKIQKIIDQHEESGIL